MREYLKAAALFVVLASYGSLGAFAWMLIAAVLSELSGIHYLLILWVTPAVSFGYFLCLRVVRRQP